MPELEPPPALPQVQPKRFLFIDALRGGAALAVLLFHLAHIHVLSPTLASLLGPVGQGLKYGEFGVQVFFVLSGFVIAHSLRNDPLTKDSILNFILRRQLRLDPPYWAVIILALGLQWAELRIPGQDTFALPSLSTIFLNLTYLQYIAGVPSILNIAWTLCLEIQFYLAFITLLGLAALLPARKTAISNTLLLFTGSLSLLLAAFYPPPPIEAHHNPWFVYYWFYFVAGVLCYRQWQNQLRLPYWMAFLALFAAAPLLLWLTSAKTDIALSVPALLTGWLTAGALFLAGRQGGLWHWGGHRFWQYLGKISYSLYLVHVLVLLLVMRIAYKITGENPVAAGIWFVVTGLLCIGAGHLLNLTVEQRSMKWTSQFKRQRCEPQEAAVPVAIPVLEYARQGEAEAGMQNAE